MILPQIDSWSTSMRMWGEKAGDEAHVCYVDDSKNRVEEIGFRLDARTVSPEYVRRVCTFSKQLGCVLMTVDYELLLPDEMMVLTALNRSTAKKYVENPVAALQNLDQAKIQRRFEYLRKLKERPAKE